MLEVRCHECGRLQQGEDLSASWIATSQMSWLWTLATRRGSKSKLNCYKSDIMIMDACNKPAAGMGWVWKVWMSGSGSWEVAKPTARAGLKTVDVASFEALPMQIRWLRKLALDLRWWMFASFETQWKFIG